MKVNMIFSVQWTTYAVEKEPEIFKVDRESNPGLCDDGTDALCIKPTGEEATVSS